MRLGMMRRQTALKPLGGSTSSVATRRAGRGVSHKNPLHVGAPRRSVPRAVVGLIAAGGAVTAAACLSRDHFAPPAIAITHVVVTASTTNVLADVLTFLATGLDSARVVSTAQGEPTLATPCVRLATDSGRIVVLDLKPSKTYVQHVSACGVGGVVSPPVSISSGALPTPLQDVRLQITGMPSSGLIFMATNRDSNGYLLAFDTTGAIRWYREFQLRQGEEALDGKQLANGDFAVFIGATHGWEPTYGRYFQIDQDGQILRTYVASAPYYTDDHEFLVSFADTAVEDVHLLGYDLRRVDLSRFGGPTDALVAGHSILRQNASGAVEFFWSAWDHFTLDDWIEPPASLQQAANTDFDHPNSIEIDRDGNYLVSWRHFGQVTKIDAVTGRIIWRLGGRTNQFTFVNDPLNGFSGQHDVRMLGNGNLLLYDNGWRHTPPETRAAEYKVDTQAMTATLVWEYRHTPPVFTGFVGSVQRLQNGNTLVGYGQLGRMTEVRADGSVAWEGQLMFGPSSQTFFYRVQELVSLYEAAVP